MYSLFKTELKQELYLGCIENKQERMLLACFRCCVLPLRVETGRYEFGGIQRKRGIPVEYRVCLCSATGKVEDKIHFLLECPRFDSLRLSMRRVAQERLREFDKVKGDSQKLFCCIMSSDVKALCRAVARFIKQAFTLRVKFWVH